MANKNFYRLYENDYFELIDTDQSTGDQKFKHWTCYTNPAVLTDRAGKSDALNGFCVSKLFFNTDQDSFTFYIEEQTGDSPDEDYMIVSAKNAPHAPTSYNSQYVFYTTHATSTGRRAVTIKGIKSGDFVYITCINNRDYHCASQFYLPEKNYAITTPNVEYNGAADPQFVMEPAHNINGYNCYRLTQCNKGSNISALKIRIKKDISLLNVKIRPPYQDFGSSEGQTYFLQEQQNSFLMASYVDSDADSACPNWPTYVSPVRDYPKLRRVLSDADASYFDNRQSIWPNIPEDDFSTVTYDEVNYTNLHKDDIIFISYAHAMSTYDNVVYDPQLAVNPGGFVLISASETEQVFEPDIKHYELYQPLDDYLLGFEVVKPEAIPEYLINRINK